MPSENQSFVEGMCTITTAGDVAAQSGMGAHVHVATRSMEDEYFYNADGEMLVVLQQGRLRFATEFGVVDAEPGEIVVIPRGVKIRGELDGLVPAAPISRRPGVRTPPRPARKPAF